MVEAKAEDARKLYDRLIGKGASVKQASKYTGYTPPESPTEPATGKPKIAEPKQPKTVRLSTVKLPMSTTKAQRIIFGIMVAVTILTIIGDITSGKAGVTDTIPRRMIAGTIAGIMLMLLAVPAPKLAAALAGLAGVTAIFVNPSGATVLTRLGGAGSTKGSDAPQQTRQRKPQ